MTLGKLISSPRTGFIFDLDDTLFDEADFLISSFTAIASELARLYPGIVDPDRVRDILTGAHGNPFDVLRAWLPDEVTQDQIWMRDIYRTHIPSISLLPGARQVLDTLKGYGAPVGIITDGRTVTQTNKIKALGLDSIIPPAHILISEATGADKSTPVPFELMEHVIPGMDRYVYFGDNPAKDIIAPRSRGWLTVQVIDRGRNIHPQPAIPAPDLRVSFG